MTERWSWLEGLAFIEALRDSPMLYPLVLTVHIAALGTTYGAVVIGDLRLLGAFGQVSWPTLLAVTGRVALCGFAIAAISGALLFATNATEYAADTTFQVKVLLITFAAAVAGSFRYTTRPHEAPTQIPAWYLRLTGGASLALWSAVVVAGRWIAF